jgi:hypothetical protein
MNTASTTMVPIYLRIPPPDIALLKFVFESYEGVAIVRTLDRHEAVLVVLAVPDFLDDAEKILADLARQVPFERIAAPAGDPDDWLMREIDREGEG